MLLFLLYFLSNKCSIRYFNFVDESNIVLWPSHHAHAVDLLVFKEVDSTR